MWILANRLFADTLCQRVPPLLFAEGSGIRSLNYVCFVCCRMLCMRPEDGFSSYLPSMLARLERQRKGLMPAAIIGGLLTLILTIAIIRAAAATRSEHRGGLCFLAKLGIWVGKVGACTFSECACPLCALICVLRSSCARGVHVARQHVLRHVDKGSGLLGVLHVLK